MILFKMQESDDIARGDIFATDRDTVIDPVAVTIASGQGVLTRGTAMAKQTGNGKYYMLNTSASDGTQNIVGFLVEDVDTTSETTGMLYVQADINRDYAIASPVNCPAGFYNNGTITVVEMG